MNTTQYIVAIEISSSKTVGAIAELTPSGDIVIRGTEIEPTINCVRYGCIQNVESTKATVNRIITKLKDYVDGDITSVYVSVAGRTLHSLQSEVTYKLQNEQVITDNIINTILKKSREKHFEGYEVIDVVPRSFVIDKREMKNPVGSFGTEIKVRLTTLVAKPNLVINLKRVFNSQMVKAYITAPLALANAVLTEDERNLGCMLIDFGAETTTVMIYRNDALEYINTLPLGGRNLTRDITALGVREESAEKIKKNIASPLKPDSDTVTIDGIKSNDAANYIAARNGEILANIIAQVDNAGLSLSELRSIVITGGGANLKGLDKEISINMANLPVRKVSAVPSPISCANYSTENIGIYSLLIEASKQIGLDSCVVKRTYSRPPVSEPEPVEPVKPEPPVTPPAPKKGGFFSKLKDRAINLISDDKDTSDDSFA